MHIKQWENIRLSFQKLLSNSSFHPIVFISAHECGTPDRPKARAGWHGLFVGERADIGCIHAAAVHYGNSSIFVNLSVKADSWAAAPAWPPHTTILPWVLCSASLRSQVTFTTAHCCQHSMIPPKSAPDCTSPSAGSKGFSFLSPKS